MAEQNSFERRNVEHDLASHTHGLMEELNLPPGLILFVKKNQKTILLVLGILAAIGIVFAIYDGYTGHVEKKAATALSLAMKAGEKEKEAQLRKVADQYKGTAAGRWGRVELAHLLIKEGKVDEGAAMLTGLTKDTSEGDPLWPLLLQNLATISENKGEYDQAVSYYTQLAAIKSFEADARKAMGRIYEKQGKNALAMDQYQKYLTQTKEQAVPGFSQERDEVEAAIHRLEQ